MARDGSASGGRPKGSLNKNTKDLREIAERLGVDPFEILLHFASGDSLSLGFEEDHKIESSLRMKAAAEVCQYLYPKRKALEHSIDESQIEEVSDELREQIEKIIKTKNE